MRNRLLIGVALAVISGFAHAENEESPDHLTRPPILQPVFNDDFAEDTRGEYKIQGDLTWEPGELRFRETTSIERRIDAGARARLHLEVTWPDVPEHQQESELRVWFLMIGATDCYVRLRIIPDSDHHTVTLALVDRGEKDGNPIEDVVREVILKDQDVEQLSVEYWNGLVLVVADTTTVMQAYVANESATVGATRIEAVKGTLHVQRFAARATARDARELNEDQKQRLAEAEVANNKLISLYRKGKFAEAAEIGEQVLGVRKSLLGELHPDYAASLNNLAVLYEVMGDRSRAEKLYKHGLELTRATLGKQHPDYAIGLSNLAQLYVKNSKYARAELLYQESRDIEKSVFGERHPTYAISVQNLGDLYHYMGDYVRAESHYREALEIKRSTVGDQHASYAITVHSLGMLYRNMADYARAERLLKQSADIRKVILGEDHPNYAVSLDGLAKLYLDMGEYARAEPLYRQSQAIRKSVFGEQHHTYAVCLNELAYLYFVMGDFARSEPLFKQALAIKDHPDPAASLNNLALLYEAKGDFDQALSLHTQAIEITRSTLGEQHPAYATSLSNLAMLFGASGDYARWEQLQTQALDIKKAVLGENHPSYATSVHNLAEVLRVKGEYARAEPIYQQARAIRKSILGEQHPDYAVSLFDLAHMYEDAGDAARAAPLYAQAFATVRQNLDQTFLVQSARQQLRNQSKMRRYLDRRIANAVQLGTGATPILHDVWQWKGAVTTRQQAYREVASKPVLNPLFDKLKVITQQLSGMYGRVPVPPPGSGDEETQQAYQRKRELWKQQFTRLNLRREDVEQQIAQESEKFRRIRQALKVEAVQHWLPKGSAFVDFLAYNHPLPNQGELGKGKLEARFVAFVLRPDREPSIIGLGSVDALTTAIIDFRRPFTLDPFILDKDTPLSREEVRKAGHRIRSELWLPIEKHLAGIDTVVISPDSVLGTLPFTALPGRQAGSFLIEDYKLAGLPMAQELPQLFEANDETPRNDALLVLGDVDYDATLVPSVTETGIPRLAQREFPGRSVRGGSLQKWSSLPGFRQELEIVQTLHQASFGPGSSITKLSEGRASETGFLNAASGSSILHIITHGYFEDPGVKSIDQVLNERDVYSSQRPGPDQFINAWMPGLLSGLVMAGANQPESHPDDPLDGILRASEIEASSLQGVDLVVLSACETGLGAVAGGEGLTGLQRAFHIAGARSVIASLWKVDDRATQELMRRFYTNLWVKKQSKIDALRNAQLWMLHHPKELESIGVQGATTRGGITDLPRKADKPRTANVVRTDPFFWAAFQLSGDWR